MIKWLCSYAEGFSYKKGNDNLIGDFDIVYLPGGMNKRPDKNNSRWMRELFPLLLQRAIEGINTSGKAAIRQDEHGITVEFDGVRRWFFSDDETVDDCKLAVMGYLRGNIE